MTARALRSLALGAALCALAAPAHAAGLLEGNHPRVQQGNDAYGKGDYEGALQHYEAAQRELRDNPELLYNLGNTYLKLKRTDEARRAYEAALSRAGDQLKPRDYYNLGNALAALDQKQDAIAAYRQALKLDPDLQPARHNLEVLLRKQESKNKTPSPGDGGTPDGGPDAGVDGGHPDAGKDGGSPDAEAPDAGGSQDAASDGGGGDGGAGDGSVDGGGDGGTGDGGSDGGSDGGGKSDQGGGDGGTPDSGTQDGGTAAPPQEPPEKAKPVDRQEAERLLDAMRRNEKQFLMQQQKRKGKQRVHPEKDW